VKKVLISAFEPFGGLTLNSSLLVQQGLKLIYKNIEVSKIALPVLYKTAFDKLLLKIDEEKPDAVLCMGQAGGRQKISVERIAVNINNGIIADNGGTLKTDEIIVDSGPEAYFTNLPYKAMIDAADDKVAISYSAGTYICNDIFYRLMYHIKTADLNIKGGFLHLPYTEHSDRMPFIDIKTQVMIVESMLAVLGE